MFKMFQTQQSIDKQIDELFAEMDKRFFTQLTELRSYVPQIKEDKDTVSMTVKGPNVVYTISANRDILPDVLKELGIGLPKAKEPSPVQSDPPLHDDQRGDPPSPKKSRRKTK